MLADPLFDRLARALAGRYTLVRELGRGGMATVYLGTDVKLGRQVAIKLLAPATRAYLGSDRFQREVLLAAQLSHPHIVPLFEADEADGLLFYVMEYVEGESLRQRLSRQGPLPVDDAVRIAGEVGDALQYAHENGVIHRDVKPENILLSRGHALVSDFGIAKLMEERAGSEGSARTGAGIAVGTAEYMSPEQASGDTRIDPRSDVYSLAAVLYEMLAGEPPFTGPSAQAIAARVVNDPLRPIRTVRPGLPLHLEQALARGLAKSPADRHRTARAFVDALATPPSQRRVSSRQAVWIATVCGAVILGWVVWRGWRVHSPPGMVLVPAGLYPVGGGGAPWRDSTAVQLEAYFIDSAEVGVAAYRRYLDATRGRSPWTPRPPDQWPATGVLWSEAVAYCAWRQRGGRLPTEDEWEAAARGPRGLRYPWGDRWEPGRANADSLHDGFTPAGAGGLGRSWIGAVDLIGNAWEWTATTAADARGQAGHVIKGGAFDTPAANATAAYRAVLPDRRAWLAHTGFRCARGVAVAPEQAPPPASVAVLYFETPDTATAYLADGLTEAIITSLGRVERLGVKSRNTVRRFRGTADDPATLGRVLGVAYLVSGSVGRPRRGQSPAVTVELLRASDGMHVWGGQYQGRDTALQAIPEAVARAVATTITGALRPVERTALASRRPRDPVAYDRFLRANYELAQRTPRAVRRAIDQYESALRLDPGLTPALARVAVGYGLFLDWGWEYPGLSPEAVLSRGFDAADRALQQDSAAADAWMARGFLLSFRNPRTFAGVSEALLHARPATPRPVAGRTAPWPSTPAPTTRTCSGPSPSSGSATAPRRVPTPRRRRACGPDSGCPARRSGRSWSCRPPTRPPRELGSSGWSARSAPWVIPRSPTPRGSDARSWPWASRIGRSSCSSGFAPAARGCGSTSGRRSSTRSDPMRVSGASWRSRRRNDTVCTSTRRADRPAPPRRLPTPGPPRAAPRPRAVGAGPPERHRQTLARRGLRDRVPPLLPPPCALRSRTLPRPAIPLGPGARGAIGRPHRRRSRAAHRVGAAGRRGGTRLRCGRRGVSGPLDGEPLARVRGDRDLDRRPAPRRQRHPRAHDHRAAAAVGRGPDTGRRAAGLRVQPVSARPQQRPRHPRLVPAARFQLAARVRAGAAYARGPAARRRGGGCPDRPGARGGHQPPCARRSGAAVPVHDRSGATARRPGADAGLSRSACPLDSTPRRVGARPARGARRAALAGAGAGSRRARAPGPDSTGRRGHDRAAARAGSQARPRHEHARVAPAAGHARAMDAAVLNPRRTARDALGRRARLAGRVARCRRVQPGGRRRRPREHGFAARALGGARRRAPRLGRRGEAAAAHECGLDPSAGLWQRASRRRGFVSGRPR